MAQIFGIDHKYFAVSGIALSVGVATLAAYKLRSMQPKNEAKTAGAELYESKKLLSEYLVFHFGTPEQLIPYPFGPKDALDFPKRCAELCLKHYKPQVSNLCKPQSHLESISDTNTVFNTFYTLRKALTKKYK